MYYQDLAGSGATNRMIKAFMSDVIVRFADFPEIRGQAELKRFLVARVELQKNYHLKKGLRAVLATTFYAPGMIRGRMGVRVASCKGAVSSS
jgi:hypothetical protein